jgi:hypothetical protein
MPLRRRVPRLWLSVRGRLRLCLRRRRLRRL